MPNNNKIRILNRYEYNPDTDFLGKGTFAEVFKANIVNEHSHRISGMVALKFYIGGFAEKYDVIEEVNKAKGINHPNLINYIAAELMPSKNTSGRTFMQQIGILEYANGGEFLPEGKGDFKAFWKHFDLAKPQNEKLLKKCLADILKGLQCLHDDGMIHRDLKPTNILMHYKENQDKWIAKIGDFGISKVVDGSNAPSYTDSPSTVEYAAPEQVYRKTFGTNKSISTNADLWAFGVIVYEIFTSKLACGGRRNGLAAEDIRNNIFNFKIENLTALNTIPQPFKNLIENCLVQHASQRIQTAGELLSILNGNLIERKHQDLAPLVPIKDDEPTDIDKNLYEQKAEPNPEPSLSRHSERSEESAHSQPKDDDEKKPNYLIPLAIAALLLLGGLFWWNSGNEPTPIPNPELVEGNTTTNTATTPTAAELAEAKADSIKQAEAAAQRIKQARLAQEKAEQEAKEQQQAEALKTEIANEWQRVQKRNTISAYEGFLAAYPNNNTFKTDAKTAIQKLKDAETAERERLAEQDRQRKAEQARIAEAERKRKEAERQRNAVPAGMVLVKGGSFQMGCDEQRDGNCFDDEKPVHTVYLDDFYIDKYEVTNQQYCQFLNARGNQSEGGESWLDIENEDCKIEKVGGTYRAKSGYANHPVIEVSWYGANAYAKWAGKSLPTEAQWEYAARGGQNSSGYKYAGSNTLGSVAWYNDNSGGKTHSVGTKSANELGIYDMSGNVWEWCADWYDNEFYRQQNKNNPICKNNMSGNRVLRGGSWYSVTRYCRSAYRIRYNPTDSNYRLGFRYTKAQ